MTLFNIPHKLLIPALIVLLLLIMWQLSHAGAIRDRIMERRPAPQAEELEDEDSDRLVSLPPGVRLMRDVPYGNADSQQMDVYLPAQTVRAPVIFMVHGGAWRYGNKGARSVVENKVAHWVTKGFVVISADYRLLPEAAPMEQALDVAQALSMAQAQAESWGGDPTKFILMGHSAGAHLIAMLASSPGMAYKKGAMPWLGTVLLDSAALDVVDIMQAKHAPLYDRAFGNNPEYWKAVSPVRLLSQTTAPILAVCSSRRAESCDQAERFVAKAKLINVRASVLKKDLSHKEINQMLGVKGRYTKAVDAFMGTLDESVRRNLANGESGAASLH